MKFRKFLTLLLSVTTVLGCICLQSGAIVTSDDFTDDELQCNTYDVRKYTDPFWEGNIVYNEVVFPIKNENEELVPFELMYDATEIVSVKNYSLNRTYQENVDYVLEDGNLVILPSGSIPVIDYIYMHPLSAPDGYPSTEIYPYYPHADGVGYEYWPETSEISTASLAVTYIHNDTWDAPVPESQEKELPNTFEKLKNDEAMTIVVVGDSVAGGAHSSGNLGIAPGAPAFPGMTLESLRGKYSNDNIRLINSAVGGTISTFNQSNVDNSIIKYSPDLVIINYGMNDSSCNRVGLEGSVFRDNIINHIEYIRSRIPECEILLLPSLYGNRYTFPAEKYEEHAGILHELAAEYDGVGIADAQMIEKYLIEETGKDYICFTADNMVHPGDLGMRLYTQAILQALSFEDISTYRTFVIDKMTEYVSDNNVDEGKAEELNAVIAEASEKISTLQDEWDINAYTDSVYPEIDKILIRCDVHVFEDTVIPPTCKEDGYTISVCRICGHESTHSYIEAPGVEHIMDSGVQTLFPTYKSEGEITYSCANCNYSKTEVVGKLTAPPFILNEGIIHLSSDHNYMAELDIQPYLYGPGHVELDLCPLNIENYNGIPYVGVWISGYGITACYNFRANQVQITADSLPFGGNGHIYASADYDWTSNGGEFEYNWKKFCVSVDGSTISIYIDGELVLRDTNSVYSTDTEVPLIYTNGECFLDNIKVVRGAYDPTSGTGGEVLGYWDMDSATSFNSCISQWGQTFATATHVNANAANVSTAHYYHTEHSGSIVGTLEAGCDHRGYNQYVCDFCGKSYLDDFTDPLYDGHTLINRTVTVFPTMDNDGEYTYECENCDLTFTEIIPKGTVIETPSMILGDANNDGVVNTSDLSLLRRFLVGSSVQITSANIDMNSDGSIGALDLSALTSKLNS